MIARRLANSPTAWQGRFTRVIAHARFLSVIPIPLFANHADGDSE
jgi:hypothetical protein